jgi:hypothetical protein
MKFLLGALLTLFVSCLAYAGGTIGGGSGGLVQEEMALSLADTAFNLESLPKAYIGGEDLRRVKARLSVAGTLSTPALVDGETVDLKPFRDSIVDVKFSKEVLPAD